jgi:hypothetical protein
MITLLLNKKHPLAEIGPWLAGAAENIVLVCGPSVPDVEAGALTGLRHVAVRPDYSSSDWLVPYCRTHKIERIIAIAESDIIRAACAREVLGLPGQSVASALAYRDKYVMKSIASAAGIPTAPMALVRSTKDIRRFVAEHGFPVVVKPRAAAACQGIVVLREEADLAKHGDEWNHLAEAWIDLPLFHVDGLMRAGEVLHSSPSRYATPNLASTTKGDPCVSAMLDPATDPRVPLLRQQTADVVRALPDTPHVNAFHAEFFLGDGAPILCEIACRPGNPTMAELQERAYGYHLHRDSILGQAADQVFTPPSGGPNDLFGWAFFPPRAGRLLAMPDPTAMDFVWFRSHARLGANYQDVSAPLDHVAKAIYRVADGDAEASLDAMVRWWNDGVEWQE